MDDYKLGFWLTIYFSVLLGGFAAFMIALAIMISEKNPKPSGQETAKTEETTDDYPDNTVAAAAIICAVYGD